MTRVVSKYRLKYYHSFSKQLFNNIRPKSLTLSELFFTEGHLVYMYTPIRSTVSCVIQYNKYEQYVHNMCTWSNIVCVLHGLIYYGADNLRPYVLMVKTMSAAAQESCQPWNFASCALPGLSSFPPPPSATND